MRTKNYFSYEKILAYLIFLSYIASRAGERSLKKLSGSFRIQFHRVVGAPRSFTAGATFFS